MKKAMMLFLVVSVSSACSTAHMKNPKHTWAPVTRAVTPKANSGDLVTGGIMYGPIAGVLVLGGMAAAMAVDAVCLPFHYVGHRMAKKEKNDAQGPAAMDTSGIPGPTQPVGLPPEPLK